LAICLEADIVGQAISETMIKAAWVLIPVLLKSRAIGHRIPDNMKTSLSALTTLASLLLFSLSSTQGAAQAFSENAQTDQMETTMQNKPDKAPLTATAEAYPNYQVSEQTERTLPLAPAQVAAIILDYTQQCKTCKYPVASVVAQEVFEKDESPYQFLVWQDVNKEINVLVGKIPFTSSSWTEVSVFESPDRQTIIIDSKLLDPERAEQASKRYGRPSEPAFSILHSRWLIQGKDQGDQSLVQGLAGGKGQGISSMVPKSVMRKELKGVLEETLDFVKP
jgi:hypothetical protein